MTIRFEFKDALRRLEKASKALNGVGHKVADIRQDIASEIVVLIDEEFRNSADPWGKTWKPKKRPNGKPTLIDSGHMRSSFFVSVVGPRIKITNKAPYSGYHQSGTATMPARKMVPDTGAMPRKWEPRLRKVAKNGFYRYFKEALR